MRALFVLVCSFALMLLYMGARSARTDTQLVDLPHGRIYLPGQSSPLDLHPLDCRLDDTTYQQVNVHARWSEGQTYVEVWCTKSPAADRLLRRVR
jgi:hypothetical protein